MRADLDLPEGWMVGMLGEIRICKPFGAIEVAAFEKLMRAPRIVRGCATCCEK
jgi:hypothetical protein